MNRSQQTRAGSARRAAERAALAGAQRVRRRELDLVELYLMQISAHRGVESRLGRTDPLSSTRSLEEQSIGSVIDYYLP